MKFVSGYYLVLSACFLTAFSQESFSLECYQCNFCNDPFNANAANIVNCTGSCEKVKRNTNVARLCSPKHIESDCTSKEIKQKGRYNTREACACNFDLCNAAAASVSSIYILSSLLVILRNTLF